VADFRELEGAMRNVVSMVIGCLVALAPAQAQVPAVPAYDQEVGVTGRLVWNLGGTLAVPLGPAADRMYVGGGFAVGLTYNVNPLAGLQFEYGADWSSLKSGFAGSATDISGNTFLQYFNLNGMVRPIRGRQFGVYLVGGGGLYYRAVDITRVDGVALAPYCDPWLYYCSAVPVTTSSVIGSRSSWDWGLDAGIGVTYAVAPSVRLYAEVRYHYTFGPSFTRQDGSTASADGQFLPITFGVRF
jgi:opacity protein-like surface antigen